MSESVWVLGATGRTGAAIATRLGARGIVPVLVGRDEDRLRAVAEPLGATVVIATNPAAMAAAIRRERPGTVVNTVGPFLETAELVVDACLAAGSDYLDLANDMGAVPALLERRADAVRAGCTLVTGAGFGVAATESVVVRLCEGMPPAAKVRTDMIPSIAVEDGVVGQALAATLLEGLPGVPGGGRFQGRRIVGGRLVPTGIGSRPVPLTTPDGESVVTGLVPLGELAAAQRASGAIDAEAASAEAPSGVLRTLFPVATVLLRLGPLRRALIRRVASVKTAACPRPREHSWAHARIEWADGVAREGWLRLGDASDATADFAAETAARLAAGLGRPGAFTPAALFGPGLAEACGGHYVACTPRSEA